MVEGMALSSFLRLSATAFSCMFSSWRVLRSDSLQSLPPFLAKRKERQDERKKKTQKEDKIKKSRPRRENTEGRYLKATMKAHTAINGRRSQEYRTYETLMMTQAFYIKPTARSYLKRQRTATQNTCLCLNAHEKLRFATLP